MGSIYDLTFLKHSICLFGANIDLYQMRLAVFVGSSELGGGWWPDTRLDTFAKHTKNTKEKREN